MSKTDRIKEEIGWLKLAFGILAALDASLVAWFAQHHATAESLVKLASVMAIVVVSAGVLVVNRMAARRFQQLEDL